MCLLFLRIMGEGELATTDYQLHIYCIPQLLNISYIELILKYTNVRFNEIYDQYLLLIIRE